MIERYDHPYRSSGLLWLIAMLLVVAIAWASLFEITQHVPGEGRLVPSGKLQTVQHLEGGIVEDILIEEGQVVDQGEALFMIQNNDALMKRNESLIKKAQLEIKLYRLLSEKNGQRDLSFDQYRGTVSPPLIQTEQDLFESRWKEYDNDLKILQDQKRQKTLRIDNLNGSLNNLKKEMDTAQEQLSLNKRLYDAGSISRSRYLDSQARVRNFSTRMQQIRQEMPIVKAEAEEIDNKKDQVIRERDIALTEDINETTFTIKQLDERIGNYADQVDRAAVMSPVKGVVNRVHVNGVGAVIKPGEGLADVLPVDEDLLVDGHVLNEDRPKIYEGAAVQLRLNAYNYKTKNVVQGTLSHISSDSFVNDRGQSYYKIKVSIAAEDVPEDITLYPGMTTILYISAGTTTILEAVFRPVWDVRDRALRRM